MAPLAGLVDGDDGFESLEKLILSYEDWITKRSKEINELESEALRMRERHLKGAGTAHQNAERANISLK
jgi:hypothetical protein